MLLVVVLAEETGRTLIEIEPFARFDGVLAEDALYVGVNRVPGSTD
jgi:hypothetical protein